MAESAIDKLKRLAREKKAASVSPVTQPVVDQETKEDIKNVSENSTLETVSIESGEVNEPTGSSGLNTNKQLETCSQQGEGDRSAAQSTIQLEDASLNLTTGELTPTPSNHPLAMEFAELEAALLAADPDFRNQLRNVHRHLGKEPELVTMMSEQEIQMIVRGLVELANSEIVEPAKAKSVKKATADLKKKVISADDL